MAPPSPLGDFPHPTAWWNIRGWGKRCICAPLSTLSPTPTRTSEEMLWSKIRQVFLSFPQFLFNIHICFNLSNTPKLLQDSKKILVKLLFPCEKIWQNKCFLFSSGDLWKQEEGYFSACSWHLWSDTKQWASIPNMNGLLPPLCHQWEYFSNTDQ